MNPQTLLIPIIVPAALAVITILIPSKLKGVRDCITLLGSAFILYFAWILFTIKNLNLLIPWAGSGLDFDLRLYHFNSFILLWINIFNFLIVVYSLIKMSGHPRRREYYTYLLLNVGLANGAVLANNFIILIFFWEGLLLTLYGLITLGSKDAHRTAVKSFIISGFCDFCMILGITILWSATGISRLSEISVAPHGLLAVSFFLMMIGAIAKAGAMPFHTWIPDAALDAPVTFMALLPASIEKLLGIYLLSRIALDFFRLEMNSAFCLVLMIIGAATIVLAVFMALIQKDFKKLLSFHAISQVGYMILGIGTAIPIGIAGGIFHMLNHAIYKCGLFLSAGSVEHRTGTTELKKLGGLYHEMPVTALCFTVCALAISGVWPLNGFVSKEMVFHGSYETGYLIFTIAAWVGAIFTFASFLKAGHSVFLGPRSKEVGKVKESESPMIIPLIVLALFCITFGLYNKLPLKLFIEPILQGHVAPGEHLNFTSHALDLFNPIALVSLLCLAIALAIHFYGWNRAGKKAYLASEPVHNLPILKNLYAWSEARVFDLYEQGIKFLKGLARILYLGVDRTIDFFYERIIIIIGENMTGILRRAHNGHYANYLAWCIAGLVVIVWILSSLLK